MLHLSERLCGEWSGTKNLYLSGQPEPDHQSESRLRVRPVAIGRGLELNYDWSHEGQPQAGAMLLVPAAESANAGWVDSWHQSSSLMHLSGTVDQAGKISLLGSFSVGSGPDWGWRIELTPLGDKGLRLQMFNINPASQQADLGVSIEYRRA